MSHNIKLGSCTIVKGHYPCGAIKFKFYQIQNDMIKLIHIQFNISFELEFSFSAFEVGLVIIGIAICIIDFYVTCPGALPPHSNLLQFRSVSLEFFPITSK